MDIKAVITAINRMQADEVVDRYAIGGNHAKTFRFNRKSAIGNRKSDVARWMPRAFKPSSPGMD